MRPAGLLAGLLVAAGGAPAGASEGAVDAGRLRALVEAQMRRSRLPAVAVSIVGPGGELHSLALSRGGEAITPDTPFLIGSVTKTLTAFAVAQLADAGRLSFDDPVVKHLPDFSLDADDGGRTITLRQLLTHTSGLRQWSGHDARAQREGRFGHIAPARPPGEAFEYSSLNYIVLGRVIEKVSGLAYGEYLRRHVFEPLGMKRSFTDLAEARGRGLARGHSYFYGLTIGREEAAAPGPLVPAGFVAASARDLGRYLVLLLGEGGHGGRQVVSAAVAREMLRPWNGEPSGPAMAWGVGTTRIGHAGSTPTFSARVALLPKERYGVVVLASVNSGPFAPGTGAVMDGIVRLLRGEEARAARPDEILLKLGLFLLVALGVARTARRLVEWRRRGSPRRLRPSRRVLQPLVLEAVAAVVVLFGIPRFVGVPLPTLLEYFPDLGLAMVMGVATGLPGAWARSTLLGHHEEPAAPP